MKNSESGRQKQLIAHYLYQHEVASKTELVGKLHISLPTVLQAVRELMEDGLVRTEGTFESTGGRKAQILMLADDARYAVGVDVTRNHIGLLLSGLRGETLRHVRLPKRFAVGEAYAAEVSAAVETMLDDARIPREKVVGVGVAVPGILDDTGMRLTRSHALGLEGFDLTPLAKALAYPCLFHNDANAAGLAEARLAGPKENMVYLSLSNSVGGAVFVQRALYQGDHHRGGEFGHMIVEREGRQCYCGKRGCLDAYCSALVLANEGEGRLEDFFNMLTRRDPHAEAVWDSYTSYLAQACDMLRMAFDCRVVLGGYVGEFIEPSMPMIAEKAARLNIFEEQADYVQACHYKTEAAALGAAQSHILRFLDGIR